MPRGVYDRSAAKQRRKAKRKPTNGRRKRKVADDFLPAPASFSDKKVRPVTGRLRATDNTSPKVKAQLDRAFARARGYEVRTTKYIFVNHQHQSVIIANDEIWIMKAVGVEPGEEGLTIVRTEIDNLNDLYVHDTECNRKHLLFAPAEAAGHFYEQAEPINQWEFVGRVDLAALEVWVAHDDFKDKLRTLS